MKNVKSFMKKAIVTVLTLALLLSSLGIMASAAVVNTSYAITNSTFDNGTTGFTSSNVTTFEAIAEPDNTTNNVLHLEGPGQYYTTVTVVPNTDYVWSFRMKSLTSGVTNIYVYPAEGWTSMITSVTDDSSNAYSALSASGNYASIETYNKTWATYSVKFNSGNNSTVKLWHNTWAAGREMYMDDWTLNGTYITDYVENGDFETAGTDTDPVPGYIYDDGGNTGASATIVDDEARGGKVLKMDAGTAYSVLHAFRIYQPVSVKPYTDYVWSFYVNLSNGQNHFVGVVAGDTVSYWKNSTVPCTLEVTNNATNYWTNNTYANGATADLNNAVDSNWKMDGGSATYGWKKIEISFNSGANDVVSLAYVARASGRTAYFDDWALNERSSYVINGGFEENAAWETDAALGFRFGTQLTSSVMEDTEGAHSGDKYLYVSANGGFYDNVATMYQTIPVAKNTNYAWSFWMKTDSTGDNKSIGVRTADGTKFLASTISSDGYFLASTATSEAKDFVNNSVACWPHQHVGTNETEWVEYTVTFNSGDNTELQLCHNMAAGGRTTYFDDWKVLPVDTIDNGDFANGVFAYNTDGGLVATPDTENYNTAAPGVSVVGGTQTFHTSITKEIAVSPYTEYVWSFWYNNVAGNSNLIAVKSADSGKLIPSVMTSDSEGAVSDYIVDGREVYLDERDVAPANWHEGAINKAWTKYNVRFFTGANTTIVLSLNLINDARSGYTDDWSLEKLTGLNGDTNVDGIFNATDLAGIRRYLLNGGTSFSFIGHDANGDGDFNILDLIYLKKIVANAPALSGYQLVWQDNFSGNTMNTKNWGTATLMSGASDLAVKDDSNHINVANGSMNLTSNRVDDTNYSTPASLTTKDTMVFKYGYVEIRAKVPFGAPAFPSFWMQSSTINANEADVMGEIDIFEAFPYMEDNYIQSGIHKWWRDGSQHLTNNSIGGHTFANNAVASEWHNYGLLWTPESLQFMVDGVVYHTIDITEGNTSFYDPDDKDTIVDSDTAVFHDYFYLIMNNYVFTEGGNAGEGTAATSDSEFPINFEIDYVRLYQNSSVSGSDILQLK